jgi:hypothetical protein
VNTGVIVMLIGCLECNQESYPLGVYPTMDEALAAHPDARDFATATCESWWGECARIAFDLSRDIRSADGDVTS